MTYGYQASTNRLTAITGANARSFGYDAYGNVLSNGVHSFQYNLAGNLTRTSDLNIDYRYDGHKRRVQEIDNNTSQTTYSMYSQSGQLMHKLKGGVATDYIYAGSLLVAEKSGSTVDYMYTDLLGSPIAGNNGSAYKEHYRPWGEKKDHPLQLSDDVGYTGHQSDIETGLTYMQARYYDPVVGRFYAVDPVGFSGSNPTYFGRYLYAGNNPIIHRDADGRYFQLVIPVVACAINAACRGAVGAAVGAAIGAVTAEEGERRQGAMKGAIYGGSSAVNPTAGAIVTIGGEATQGAYEAATDNDSSTNPSSAAVGGAVDGAIEVLTGSGAGKLADHLGANEVLSGGVSTFGGSAADIANGGSAGNTVASALNRMVESAPLVPNGGEVKLHNTPAPKPEDWLRQSKN